jgi:hypothetical protein
MSNRAERRRFKAEAERELLTYLVEPTDPRLDSMPLLKNATRHWLTALKHRVRHCAVCSVWVVDERDVGALLLGVATRANSVGTTSICRECWNADLSADVLERACAVALRQAIPNGKFAPMDAG